MNDTGSSTGMRKAEGRLFWQESGFGLIAIIGLLGLLSVGLAVWSPSLIRILDRTNQEMEEQALDVIGKGILTYIRQNKTFPPSLVNLIPDYVPFSPAQLTTNPGGFPRYYALHPAMAIFNNSTGLTAGELPNVPSHIQSCAGRCPGYHISCRI